MPAPSFHLDNDNIGGGRLRRAFRLARRSLALPGALALAGLVAMVAAAPANALLVSAQDGRLASFSGGISQVNGTLTATSARYAADSETFVARYSGPGSGVARGSFKVSWSQGQSVAYGAAFYLPTTFHAADKGQQALLTWDNAPGVGGSFEEGGVVIDYSDDYAYLVDSTMPGSPMQRVLAGPFRVPLGRWFTLQVRQVLGSGAAARSQVYENSKLVASSRAANFSGQTIGHVRFGIVQLSGGAQQGRVTLRFDRALAAVYTGYVNPFGKDHYRTERTDMGVDFCLTRGEPIHTVGDGVVVGISPNWFEHEPYIWYQLIDGPYAGRYVYVAEQIGRLARVGAALTAGHTIAYYKRSGTCIETGWSAADGATLAQATTGYHEGQITPAGVSFAHFLISLGVKGHFELKPTR